VLGRLRAAAETRAAAGLRRSVLPRSPDFDGMLDLASNDYLGLCGDPRLTAGAVAAAREWGTGSTGSRLVTGSTGLHARLEASLASFAGAAEALVFSSGYLANLAVITALAGALSAGGGGVLIVSDARNHASLIDACRLARSGAVRLAVAPHRDVAAVEQLLAVRSEDSALVVTDSVFSVDGALAPVASLHAVVRAHDALLVLDEAHALGVLGPGGAGLAAEAGVGGQPDVVRTATLSKSLASQGGAVLAVAEIIDTVVDTGRGFIFDTGLAPPSAGAALAALDVLRSESGLGLGRGRGSLALANARRLAELASGLGFTVVPPSAAVVAVILGDPRRAVLARETCAAAGVRAGCFRPPSVPDGQACLRLTARATMTEHDFVVAERALTRVRDHC
jgi:8-amino-7-oxononanoate synthase